MRFVQIATFVAGFCFAATLAHSQVATTGSIVGVVKDSTGAVIPGAVVVCIGQETGSRAETVTTDSGLYTCLSQVEGVYRVEGTAAGFSKGVVANVKVNVASSTTVDIRLEVGGTTETVQVEAQATPVITSTTAIQTTITGRQITELPLPTRSALDLAFQMAGASGGGGVRYASFNSLPKGALNVAIDGVNVQDNLLKSSSGGGFYTYIQPRIDSVDEVTVSSAANGASTGEGAVQITFVTKRGTNNWHGTAFEYLRNNALNANTWRNNAQGLPRQVLKLNQFGGNLGGPIIKNRLFIFGVWDEFRLPNSIARTRTVLKPSAINGIFTYRGTDNQERGVNVLQVAANNGFRSTPDANILGLLRQIDSLRAGGSVGITPSDLFRDTMSFNNLGFQRRFFPTVRTDYVINSRMQVEATYYYQGFRSQPDTLNGYDRTYPGFETLNGRPAEGGQNSNRFQGSMAWRWAVSAVMNNEFRVGLNGGSIVFAGGMDQGLYPGNTRLGFPLGLTSPLSLPRDSRRNTPVWTISDTYGWQKGKHTLNFGFSYTRISSWDKSIGTAVPLASMGITANDPANAMFTTANFPALNPNDQGSAAALYALLTGRLSGVAGVVNVNEETKKYSQYDPLTRREYQRQLGLFVTDSWRVRPSVTITAGLRWEYQGIPNSRNGIYTMPAGGYAGLFGVSGQDNLFKPGTLTGQASQLVAAGQSWNKQFANFAPNLGLAWSPTADSWWRRLIFGEGGALRFGYSINYTREGMNNFRGLAGANPGPTASAALVADRDFRSGSLFYDGTIPPLVTFPTAFAFPLPLSSFTFTSSASLNWFDPNLKPPRIHSYSIGIQRQVARDTVLEARYVGNIGDNLWRQNNLNEVNIVENGFLKEFQVAQNNLAVCTANRAACTGSATGALRFDNRGLPGQANTPILNAAFAGVAAGTSFASSTFVTALQQGTAGSMASTLNNSNLYMGNLTKVYPRNFFVVNPDAIGSGSYLLANGATSSYNSLQVELRRRMSQGLLLSANYTFAKGMSDAFADDSGSYKDVPTMRDYSLARGPSPYDIRHVFKMNWLYELPFGAGRPLVNSANGVLSRLVGGWQFNGVGRIQSGQPFQLTGGRATFNQLDAGVIPMVSRQELQSMVRVDKRANGTVFWTRPELIGSDGRANAQYLQVPTTAGQMGYQLFLYGLSLVRIDMTLAKRTRITERLGLELRAEALNAMNISNFMVGSPASSTASTSITGTTFGRTTNYYNDFNGSQDPGGRVIQLVMRLSF
ncbi:MAG: carboxypeptidase regulatory-like domain-containing protein [Acidobacteria bacterium]|nr:carboxypeptidase regulatory-like domain-containing protein [Acidobacteriota bacterium]